MGDTTNHTLTVYACPVEQVKAVLDTIESYLSGNDYGGYDALPNTLHLGGTIGSWDVLLGNVDEIASALMEYAPGAYFEVFCDPKHEWLGDLRQYAPELGLFSAECDSDGAPVFGTTAIQEIIALESFEEREAALGGPWSTTIGAVMPDKDDHVLVPALSDCPGCGEWAEVDHFDKTCTTCVEILTEQEAKGQHRVVLDHLPDSDLVYVIARPSEIVFECATCTDANTLSNQHIVEVSGLAWPTEAETHKAHSGFAIGAGDHKPENMRIKEVLV